MDMMERLKSGMKYRVAYTHIDNYLDKNGWATVCLPSSHDRGYSTTTDNNQVYNIHIARYLFSRFKADDYNIKFNMGIFRQ